jgi:hypothetical protein
VPFGREIDRIFEGGGNRYIFHLDGNNIDAGNTRVGWNFASHSDTRSTLPYIIVPEKSDSVDRCRSQLAITGLTTFPDSDGLETGVGDLSPPGSFLCWHGASVHKLYVDGFEPLFRFHTQRALKVRRERVAAALFQGRPVQRQDLAQTIGSGSELCCTLRTGSRDAQPIPLSDAPALVRVEHRTGHTIRES